jgi:predicted ATPase
MKQAGTQLTSACVDLSRLSSAEHVGHPFDLPLIQAQPELRFETPVTFLVGENGSGKSTLLEAIACAVGMISAGAEDLERDPTFAGARALADHLRLTWRTRTRKGLFLRAQDFFGYTQRLTRMGRELEDERRDAEVRFKDSSAYARELAQGPYRKERGALQRRYGAAGLMARSHGEGFLDFFLARFVPDGVYVLDEPETPLSPARQLTLIKLMHDMVKQRAQFIIATHSPILMAFPGARIYRLSGGGIAPIAYDDIEHVRLTRQFLSDPHAFVRRLTADHAD